MCFFFFFFKQKTAYEMRISDWSSDVCSSDLTSPTETAKIKAMVEAGAVEWDLVDVGGRTVFQGGEDGFLEELDLAKVPNAKALETGWVSPYGVAPSTGPPIFAWSTNAFPDAGPPTRAVSWYVARFPCPHALR